MSLTDCAISGPIPSPSIRVTQYLPSLPFVPWNLATSEAYVRAETWAMYQPVFSRLLSIPFPLLFFVFSHLSYSLSQGQMRELVVTLANVRSRYYMEAHLGQCGRPS